MAILLQLPKDVIGLALLGLSRTVLLQIMDVPLNSFPHSCDGSPTRGPTSWMSWRVKFQRVVGM